MSNNIKIILLVLLTATNLFACSIIYSNIDNVLSSKSDIKREVKSKDNISILINIDDDFSNEEVSEIINGLNLWQEQSKNKIYWMMELPESKSINPYIDRRIRIRKSQIPLDIKEGDKTVRLGYANAIGGDMITLVPEAAKKCDIKLSIVIAHEFGHALGVEHININSDQLGIMSPLQSASTKLCISKLDALNIKTHLNITMVPNCDFEKLSN